MHLKISRRGTSEFQLGCVSSGNKLQKQKKGPWNLGERKPKGTCLGERRSEMERYRHAPKRERMPLCNFRSQAIKEQNEPVILFQSSRATLDKNLLVLELV